MFNTDASNDRNKNKPTYKTDRGASQNKAYALLFIKQKKQTTKLSSITVSVNF